MISHRNEYFFLFIHLRSRESARARACTKYSNIHCWCTKKNALNVISKHTHTSRIACFYTWDYAVIELTEMNGSSTRPIKIFFTACMCVTIYIYIQLIALQWKYYEPAIRVWMECSRAFICNANDVDDVVTRFIIWILSTSLKKTDGILFSFRIA